jgi:hypothetical protein
MARSLSIFFLAFVFLQVAIGADPPVKVKIVDEKKVEAVLPLDPAKAVTYQAAFGLGLMVRVDNQQMHLGNITTQFKIDSQIVYPNVQLQPMPLPKTLSGKTRDGVMQKFQHGAIEVTQTMEVVPGKPVKDGQKRRLDTVLVRYTIENKDKQPHEVATRVLMNSLIANSRNIQFAAPTEPDKLLNGVELKDAKVPPYVRLLQNADLKNPGMTGVLSYRLNKNWEMPSRLVMGRLQIVGGDAWTYSALPANGFSAVVTYWAGKAIKPGEKRELAYAYGGGIAGNPENEGAVKLVLGGSFEPGKLFTLAAYVDDPAPGQSLTLELPAGMERVEGKESQPLAAPSEENPSLVLWKARVLRTGDYRVRVRSSTGLTLTKVISITKS